MMMRRGVHRRTGAVIVMTTVCLIGLMAMFALAIDIGMIAVARCQCQNAADSAAMVGARTITGDSANNYNFGSAPGNSFTAASGNKIFMQGVQVDMSQIDTPNAHTFSTGQVKVEIGSYAYVYNDGNPGAEEFKVAIPRTDNTQPYSVVRATVQSSMGTKFARIFGTSTANVSAVAVAAHRPRDVMLIVDLSGSMRFQSLPGTPHGSAADPSGSGPRTKSLNPESVIPLFGHYSNTSGAALIGNTSLVTSDGSYVDPSNISTTSDAGPPICEDFTQHPAGSVPTSGDTAFTRAPDSYATTPGGDDYLKQTLDTSGSYAQTVYQFNNNSMTTNPLFEVKGYEAVRAKFNGYTQGPGYWGKTFWIWPPSPPGTNVVAPPGSISSTSFNWYDNGSDDWRQRFFVAVNTATSAPSWPTHNTVLFDSTGRLKIPGTTTTVTENGANVTYTYRINYQAILYWLSQSPAPFPNTLAGGRIRYYSKFPNGKDNSLNNRWWTSSLSSLPNDEKFWKEYIDFVLGFTQTGVNTYTNKQGSTYISALIGNGDYYNWSGATIQVKQRPNPVPPTSDPDGPYQTGTTSAAAAAGASSVSVTTLGTAPTANSHYVMFGSDTTPYLITNSSTTTLNVSPSLKAAVAKSTSAKIYSPYMDYKDNVLRPKHQFWFGPMTFVDWLGNYNLNTLNGGPHHWWPGNVHEAQGWQCKAGIQTAIDDIRNNHPNDFVALTFFSSPKTSVSGNGSHNKAVIPFGRQYQQLKDSLWFPPSTVTGGVSEISPYDPDMANVPRANGGTGPGMGFMIAYNQLSSSVSNLRLYATPTSTYRGSAGGLGRKGANRIIIFETDGYPNSRAYANITGSGANAYYPVRVKDPVNLSNTVNTEWPTGGSYADKEVFDVVKQICAQTTASPPGFSTPRKPVEIHCIGYGQTYDPANAGSAQTAALTFLQTIQYYGNTSSDTVGSNFPQSRRIYGSTDQRVANMQAAFKSIMQSGVQVSLLE